MDRVSILGISYTVVHDAELADDEEGLCVPSAAEVRVSKEVPPARQWSVLAHEIAHAVCLESGFRHRIIDGLGLSEERGLQFEEQMLQHFLPAYLDTLQRNGWLKPPVKS